jgi:hypothetical protein
MKLATSYIRAVARRGPWALLAVLGVAIVIPAVASACAQPREEELPACKETKKEPENVSKGARCLKELEGSEQAYKECLQRERQREEREAQEARAQRELIELEERRLALEKLRVAELRRLAEEKYAREHPAPVVPPTPPTSTVAPVSKALLAKRLRSCRTHYRHNKKKRLLCERRARKHP